MENWYVAQTKYAQEKRAQQQLQEQGVTCLLPMISEVMMHNGQVRAVKPQPMFPNYIFVRFDPEVVHTTAIKATRGVSTLVSFGGLPAIVPDGIITRLSEGLKCVPTDTATPVHGDRVVIRDGAFDGLEAVWFEPDGLKRAVLLLNLINREVRVPVRGDMRFHIVERRVAA